MKNIIPLILILSLQSCKPQSAGKIEHEYNSKISGQLISNENEVARYDYMNAPELDGFVQQFIEAEIKRDWEGISNLISDKVSFYDGYFENKDSTRVYFNDIENNYFFHFFPKIAFENRSYKILNIEKPSMYVLGEIIRFAEVEHTFWDENNVVFQLIYIHTFLFNENGEIISTNLNFSDKMVFRYMNFDFDRVRVFKLPVNDIKNIEEFATVGKILFKPERLMIIETENERKNFVLKEIVKRPFSLIQGVSYEIKYENQESKELFRVRVNLNNNLFDPIESVGISDNSESILQGNHFIYHNIKRYELQNSENKEN